MKREGEQGMTFQVGDAVVVTEEKSHHGNVTKISRRYLVVETKSRSWSFDKETRAYRGSQCGYVPRLRTVIEFELDVAYEALMLAARALPYVAPRGATLERIREATTAIVGLTENKP